MTKQNKNTTFSNIPVEGSLGLLAIGDLAFIAWREVKKEHNKNERKSNKENEEK